MQPLRKQGFKTALMIITAALPFSPGSAWAGGGIAAYYPSTTPVKARQDALKSEVGGDVVFFAKYKDFQDYLASGGPSLVIAPSSFSHANKGYKPVLKFVEAEADKSKFLALTKEKAKWDGKVGQARIGVVEELDRAHLKEYFGQQLGTELKTVKSVSKPEDLFPLLALDGADVLVLSNANYRVLATQFKLNVGEVAESKPRPEAVVYVKDGADEAATVERIKSLTEATLKVLGFTKTEAFGAAQ